MVDVTIRDILEARAHGKPDNIFLYYRDQTVTYAELNSRANRVANAFHGLGLKKGGKVGIMMPNCPESLYLWMGLSKMGIWAVFINHFYKDDSLKYLLTFPELDALVVSTSFLDRVEGLLPNLKHTKIIYAAVENDCPEPAAKSLILDELMAASDDQSYPRLDLKGSDISALIHTSGTTGWPKFCLLSNTYYIVGGRDIAQWVSLNELDKILACLPLYHINPHICALLPGLLCGASVILMPWFSASQYWSWVRRYQATVLVLHFQLFRILLKQPAQLDDRAHSARVALPAPGQGEILRAFHERFGVDLPGTGFGMTETNCTVAFTSLYDVLTDPSYYSQPSIGGKVNRAQFDTRIVDDNGNDCPSGAVGEIVVRARTPEVMFSGYYKMPEKTQEVYRQGWYHTGDLGYLDESDHVHHVERKVAVIRRKGEFISPEIIQDAANTHPGVQESLAVGVPSELGDHDIKVYLVPRAGHELTLKSVMSHLEERLAYFMLPRWIAIVASLPRISGTEKVARHGLEDNLNDAVIWEKETSEHPIRRR